MDLSYPIGKFDRSAPVLPAARRQAIQDIAEAPARLREAVGGLTAAQLDTPYRPEGWTVRQVVHHLADSHVNSYIRFRLALTEDSPLIKPYDHVTWAALPDARTVPVELSLALLDGMHGRWAVLLNTFTDAEFARTFRHPENGTVRLDTNLALYAWHGRHHTAHITGLRHVPAGNKNQSGVRCVQWIRQPLVGVPVQGWRYNHWKGPVAVPRNTYEQPSQILCGERVHVSRPDAGDWQRAWPRHVAG